jgi:ABC-2 type transport system permease protein
MHNVWLIAKREYLERIRTKSFIVMTVLIPALMIGGGLLSAITSARTKSASHIAVVSADTQLALDLQKELQDSKNSRMTVDVISPPAADTRATLDGELSDKALDGYLWITPAPSNATGATGAARPTFSYKPRSRGDIATEGTISGALRTVLMREQLAHKGMVASDVDALLQPVEIDSSSSSAVSSFVGAYIMFLLMYVVVLLHGMNVARSIIEEKTSRVFEVLLATIRPEELLAGKILGVGSVGLTQVFLWLVTATLITSTALLTSVAGGGMHVSIGAAQIVFFFVYFLLGFLLYASIAAALGAMVNSEQELQQLNMVLVLPLVACMFVLGAVITNPSGTLATVISLIPFCTPLIMYLRISIAMPPVWQIALSLVLMAAAIYVAIWIASRIYRVGILMYGKRPNLPEILRWLKYS